MKQDPLEKLEGGYPLSSHHSEIDGAKVVRALRGRGRRRAMASSLCVSILAGFVMMWIPKVQKGEYQSSIVWLKSEQLKAGHWQVSKWGGKDRFEVGVSAMALLSLMKWDEKGSSEEIQAGLDYLIRSQQSNGLLGKAFLGDLYNHSLGTLALKEGHNLGFQVSVDKLNLAQSFLRSYQNEKGLWAYRQGLSAEQNLSCWAELALSGQVSQVPIEKWKSQSETFAQGRTLIEQSNVFDDPMDVFFGKIDPSTFDARSWKLQLLASRELDGPSQGAWPIQGPWGHVGGQVFTTGMALLSLDSLQI